MKPGKKVFFVCFFFQALMLLWFVFCVSGKVAQVLKMLVFPVWGAFVGWFIFLFGFRRFRCFCDSCFCFSFVWVLFACCFLFCCWIVLGFVLVLFLFFAFFLPLFFLFVYFVIVFVFWVFWRA